MHTMKTGESRFSCFLAHLTQVHEAEKAQQETEPTLFIYLFIYIKISAVYLKIPSLCGRGKCWGVPYTIH